MRPNRSVNVQASMPPDLARPSPQQLGNAVEAMSGIDGTVGWYVTIGGGAPPWLSGFLLEAVAHRIFVADRALVAGNLAPMGQAVAVPGGYHVSGHWTYGSGILHSAWIATGCVVMEGDGVRRTSDGTLDT